VSRHFVRVSPSNAQTSAKFGLPRSRGLPLHILVNQSGLLANLLIQLHSHNADLKFEQLAPEDAYLSCKLKLRQLAVRQWLEHFD
jgi:hypothetical protein